MFALELLRKCTHHIFTDVHSSFGRVSVQLFTSVINQSRTISTVLYRLLFSYFFVILIFVRFFLTVPDGKPQVTSAHNSSSTSIYLNWKPPPKSSIHGEFLGYRLAYKPRDDTSPESVQEIFLRDPSIESHAIQGLQTFTQYMISLQVFNPEGLGPSSTVIVMTDEGGKYIFFFFLSKVVPPGFQIY
uniref:Fibronectin type-III domain-containing protein n=1 Tax=Daphnia galeata TaxID=27404 RepID=A0A8J2WKH9_9CRUS|nr:unnamed protein product [Daphnia galeata]